MAQTTSWVTRAVVFLIVGLLIGVAIGYFVFPSTTAPAPAGGGRALPSEIKFGALLALTGELASFGNDHMVALQLAVSEANNYLQKAGIPSKVTLDVEDTQTNPNVALQKLQAMYANGIKFVFGPLSSNELRNLIAYAKSNGILLFSQSSTAIDLANATRGYVFRGSPNDAAQGVALALAMQKVGIKYLIIMNRHDTYGDGLASSVATNFKNLGGTVLGQIPYDYNKQEFTVEVQQLNTMVQSAVNQYGNKTVAVELIAFEEAAVIITEALQYPVLSQVRWFGSDGTAGSAKLTEDPAVANFCIKTKFLNTITAPAAENDITIKVKNYVMQKLGREPDSYTYVVYDEFWLLFYAILSVGYDPAKVAAALPYVAQGYVGASGPIQFDQYGDRVPVAYAIQAIVYNGTAYTWENVGQYLHVDNSVTLQSNYD